MKKKLFSFLKKLKDYIKITALLLPIFGIAAYNILSLYDYRNAFFFKIFGDSVAKITVTYETQHGPVTGGGTSFQYLSNSLRQYTVTNDHVCQAALKQEINEMEINNKKYKILFTYKKHDVCLLEPRKDVMPLIGNDYLPYPMEKMFFIGHPALLPKFMGEGNFISVYMLKDCIKDNGWSCLAFRTLPSYYIDMPILGGASGSPVFNRFGQVVAIFSHGGQKHLAFAAPVKYIDAAIEEYEQKTNSSK